MVTVLLQCLWASLSLWYGVTAWRVARQPAGVFGTPARRLGWWAAGAGFTLIGASNVLFNSWAAYAWSQGPGSAAWDGILRWMRVGSYGRACLVFAVTLLLGLAAHRGGMGRDRFRRLGGALLALALLGGSLAGWAGGEVLGKGGQHFAAIAQLCAAEAILLMGVLGYALHRDSMDRYLWLSICTYTLMLVLNVVWFSALAWTDQPGSWAPLRYTVHAYTIAAYLLMNGAAMRKLRTARRGQTAPDVLSPLPGRRVRGDAQPLWKLSDAE